MSDKANVNVEMSGNVNDYCSAGDKILDNCFKALSFCGELAGSYAHEWRDNANSGNTQWHKDLANGTSNFIDSVTSKCGSARDNAVARK